MFLSNAWKSRAIGPCGTAGNAAQWGSRPARSSRGRCPRGQAPSLGKTETPEEQNWSNRAIFCLFKNIGPAGRLRRLHFAPPKVTLVAAVAHGCACPGASRRTGGGGVEAVLPGSSLQIAACAHLAAGLFLCCSKLGLEPSKPSNVALNCSTVHVLWHTGSLLRAQLLLAQSRAISGFA